MNKLLQESNDLYSIGSLHCYKSAQNWPLYRQIPFHPKVVASSYEGGIRKVRKPQNRTKNKKPQYRIEIYRNTETAGCPRQDLQSFYPLKIRPAVYADINSNAKLLNY